MTIMKALRDMVFWLFMGYTMAKFGTAHQCASGGSFTHLGEIYTCSLEVVVEEEPIGESE